MKALIVIFSFLTLMSSFAATISAKALAGIDSRIEEQRSDLNKKLNAANTDDFMEGKIVAAMANMIENKLEKAEKELALIESDDELTEENVAKINAILDESEKLIKEI